MSTIFKQVSEGKMLSWGWAAWMAMLLVGCGHKSVVGQQIQFGLGGGSEQYRTAGWSHTEEKFTWTEGNSAKLSLPIDSEAGPFNLRMTLSAFSYAPNWPGQPVEILV